MIGEWPQNRLELLRLGICRANLFCDLNEIPRPEIVECTEEEWNWDACAWYRPDSGIQICPTRCQFPCGPVESRNWTWPGSVTDREPYGVIAHELGHHCDWLAGNLKGSYYSDYGLDVKYKADEKPITSYSPNPAEWFAEMFRLFVTNPDLLRHLRPKTFSILRLRWKPVNSWNWRRALGRNVPDRVIRTLTNKGAK